MRLHVAIVVLLQYIQYVYSSSLSASILLHNSTETANTLLCILFPCNHSELRLHFYLLEYRVVPTIFLCTWHSTWTSCHYGKLRTSRLWPIYTCCVTCVRPYIFRLHVRISLNLWTVFGKGESLCKRQNLEASPFFFHLLAEQLAYTRAKPIRKDRHVVYQYLPPIHAFTYYHNSAYEYEFQWENWNVA